MDSYTKPALIDHINWLRTFWIEEFIYGSFPKKVRCTGDEKNRFPCFLYRSLDILKYGEAAWPGEKEDTV